MSWPSYASSPVIRNQTRDAILPPLLSTPTRDDKIILQNVTNNNISLADCADLQPSRAGRAS